MLYHLLKYLAFFLFKFLFFLKITGKENIPKTGGCIIASNHVSFLDPIVLAISSPRVLSFMARHDLFRVWWFGKLLTNINVFPVRKDIHGDFKAIRTAIHKLKSGKALIIFPEGTRSKTGKMKEAEQGVALLAAKAGALVIPTLVVGTDKAMPVGQNKIFLFKHLRVHFDKPIDYKELNLSSESLNNYKIFADQVIQRIQKIENKIT